MLIGQLHNFFLHLGAVGSTPSSFFQTRSRLFFFSTVSEVPGTSLSLSCIASSRTDARWLSVKAISRSIHSLYMEQSTKFPGSIKETLLELMKGTELGTPESFSLCSIIWRLAFDGYTFMK